MQIESQFNRTVDVDRLSPVANTNTEEFAAHLSDVACEIQPLDEAWSEDADGSFGKDWLMFCAVCDILEHDRVYDGTNYYRVVGVESFEFLGSNKHMEVRLRKSIT